MDKAKKYRKIVKNILHEIANTGKSIYEEIRYFVVEDEKNGHYLLFSDGWVDNSKRFYGCSVHVEVKDTGRVYLHYDGTDFEVGKMLLEKGIPLNELVPAFQPPAVRKEMGYAIS